MHLSTTSSYLSPVFFLQIFLPSRLDILLPFPQKKNPIWLGLFGQVSLLENSSYNNCYSELDPFTYCSHSFGSGVDPISILLSCAFMYLNDVLSLIWWWDGLKGSFTTSLRTGVGWHQSCTVCNKFSRSLQQSESLLTNAWNNCHYLKQIENVLSSHKHALLHSHFFLISQFMCAGLPPLSICLSVSLSMCVLVCLLRIFFFTSKHQPSGVTQMQIKVKWELASLSPGASPLLPYNYCSIPFKSAPAFLLHPCLFLPPQELKLLACASLAIFSYYPSGLRGSFTTSSLFLAIVRPD